MSKKTHKLTALLADGSRIQFISPIPVEEVVEGWLHARECQTHVHVSKLTREDGSYALVMPQFIVGFDTNVPTVH